MGRDITRPTTSMVGGEPIKGKAVKFEPFEHLFQHIKQSDPRLYEALKRAQRSLSEVSDVINTQTTIEPKFDKATFGLQKPLVVGIALTNYYICRKGGTFIDIALKNKVAPDSSTNLVPTILDIQISKDDGANWRTLFNSSDKITIINGSVTTLIIPKEKLGVPAIAVKDLLRIDCVQAASPNPGQYYEVVLKWE